MTELWLHVSTVYLVALLKSKSKLDESKILFNPKREALSAAVHLRACGVVRFSNVAFFSCSNYDLF